MTIYNWHKIGDISVTLLEENKLTEVIVAGKRVGLLRKSNTVYAFSATCPHAGGSLCQGWVDVQGRIVCPDHKYRFDPANGRNTTGEGYKLMTYPVEIKEDGLYIGLLC